MAAKVSQLRMGLPLGLCELGDVFKEDVRPNSLQVEQARTGDLAKLTGFGISAEPLRHGLWRALAKLGYFRSAAQSGNYFFMIHTVLKHALFNKDKHALSKLL